MRMVSKFLILTLLILLVVQLNAFPVPSYSYAVAEPWHLQVGMGLLSAMRYNDKLDYQYIFQPFIKLGFPYNVDVALDWRYRADLGLSDYVYYDNDDIIFSDIIVSAGKGFKLNSETINKIGIRAGMGIGEDAENCKIASVNVSFEQFDITAGCNTHNNKGTDTYSLDSLDYSYKVDGLFAKVSMESDNRRFNIRPYIFVQYERWQSVPDNTDTTDDEFRQLIYGGGFSFYFQDYKEDDK